MISIGFALAAVVFICDAKINITIHVESNRNNTKINYFGRDDKTITDSEIKLFNITDENLKRGLRIELGKAPDDVFLKDPTPYSDLFKKYKWPESKRSLRVINAKIIEQISQDVVLKTHEHINNTTESIISKRILFHNIENTVFSSWSKNGLPEDDIFYEINLNFGYGRLNYENKWRDSSQRSVLLSFGVAKKNDIIIKSGQTLLTKLTASKIILLVEIQYVAQLTGCVIANYAHVYGKYHFWSPFIENIMKCVELKNEIKTTELLEIRCYVDPKLEAFDKLSGEPIRVLFEI